MDHREVLYRLDDYGAGRLSETVRTEMEEHLHGCEACTREVERARRLREQVAELPRSVAPRRDLWPEIQARIHTPETVERSWSRLAGRMGQALAVAAAMAVLLVGTWWVAEQREGRERQGRAETQALPEELTRTLWALEADIQGTGRSLMAARHASGSGLGEEGLESINRGLNALSLAIAESQAALRDDPQNPLIAKRITRYYQQRLELLQRATRLAART